MYSQLQSQRVSPPLPAAAGENPVRGHPMGTDYLNGWDAMVATSQANINAAMVLAYNANLLPHSLKKEFTITVFDFDIPAKVDSRLGAWRLSGGSGKNAVI